MTVLETAEVLKVAVPGLLEAFNVVTSAAEHVVLRLALLWFLFYGIYRTIRSH